MPSSGDTHPTIVFRAHLERLDPATLFASSCTMPKTTSGFNDVHFTALIPNPLSFEVAQMTACMMCTVHANN
jgi:hypothetical protein